MNRFLFKKGSTLLETIMAITIVTLCSLIGTLVYGKVIDATPPILKYSVNYEMEKMISRTLIDKDITPIINEFKGFQVVKEVVLKGSNGLFEVTFLATFGTRKIERKIWVRANEN